MPFNLGKFFEDVFKPGKDEVVSVVYDLPHDNVADNPAWQDRREMAEEWQKELAGMADRWDMTVNPLVTYQATGKNNSDLPELCMVGDEERNFVELIESSSIILAMPEFSATAPLYRFSRNSDKLRVGSMPGVARFMQESGLSADYSAIAEKCKILEEIFNKAIGAEVTFSSGHKCYFDLPRENPAQIDDGILHPERAGSDMSLSNLPAGEVFQVPNEKADSETRGELPEQVGDHIAVYMVEHNRIVEVRGEGSEIEKLRRNFQTDPAWCNIAEFAVGLNDKAKVTGIVLEDEKAGFHWAYGRSDHFTGGTVGVADFNSPGNVVHTDIVYAKGNPIVCAKLDMIFPDGSRQTLIIDGDLQV